MIEHVFILEASFLVNTNECGSGTHSEYEYAKEAMKRHQTTSHLFTNLRKQK